MLTARSQSAGRPQLCFDVTVCTLLQIRSTLVLPQPGQVTLVDDDSDIGRTISNVF
jgi:hypothetical protein